MGHSTNEKPPYIYIYILESKCLPIRGQLPVAVASWQFSNFKKVSLPVARCLWQMPQTLLQQIVEYKAPRQPSRIHLEFPPWQLPRGSGIAASLQLQKVTLPVPRCPWPMPPTSLRCGRLPVAVASLQLSLCQAYRCLLRFHQKSMENPPWRVPGGAQASPEGSRCHFVVPGRLPERPGSLPKAPADAHGTALEPPRVARGGPRARFSPKIMPKWSKMHEK